MINFIDNGTDQEVFEYLAKSLGYEVVEDLEKAMHREGLMPKIVTAVNKKTGKQYQKTVYVKIGKDENFKIPTQNGVPVEGCLPVREIKNPAKFIHALYQAKMSTDKSVRWRVSYNSKDTDNYKDCKMYATQQGDVFAIREGGDIISVCRNLHDDKYKSTKGLGKALLKTAFACGGKKLDTYDGNFGFYIKCGLKPVSWCEFDPQYAPDDWNGVHEDIVFFTLGKSEFTKLDDFKKSVKVSESYDDAEHLRDKAL